MSKNIRFLKVQWGNRFLTIPSRYTHKYTKTSTLVFLGIIIFIYLSLQSKTGSEKDSGMSKSRLDGGGEGSIQLGSQMAPLFDIMCSVLRMPGVASHRSLLASLAFLKTLFTKPCIPAVKS